MLLMFRTSLAIVLGIWGLIGIGLLFASAGGDASLSQLRVGVHSAITNFFLLVIGWIWSLERRQCGSYHVTYAFQTSEMKINGFRTLRKWLDEKCDGSGGDGESGESDLAS